ncbi:glycerophosphodiester phosphodiesterase [Sphingomonas sp.]|uniref:glycerophosphodiester phosphodiesterase n=1 Tax=Sphingomonas sp. TaxID=28214 RepID=UPI002DD67BF4|nr:glycerophosphodiester phosphodiesterase family protein [Sphingomonas sp.]
MVKIGRRQLIAAAGAIALALGVPALAQTGGVRAPAATDERALRSELTKMYSEHAILPIPIHRGGGMHLPENTIEAFEYTWARHMVPEADIRTSKDGVIVVIHDDTVTRTAPGTPEDIRRKRVDELTLAELKTVDVGAFRGHPGQRIPTLDEVFAVMAKDRRKFLHLDYKSIDLDVLAGMVRRHGVERQVIFTTNRHDLILEWRRRLPRSQTMIWMGGTQQEINATLDALRATSFSGVYIVHMHYRPVPGTGAFNMSDKFMLDVQAELAAQGIVVQVQPWNIEDPLIYERLFSIGIRNVGTDFPDMLRLIRPRFFR